MKTFIIRYRSAFLIAILMAILAYLFFPNLWRNELSHRLLPIQKSLTAAVGLSNPSTQEPAIVYSTYIEIVNSCDIQYKGDCVVARSGPSTDSPVVTKLRNGIVLAVYSKTNTDSSGRVWYHVFFDEVVRYPERLSADWYVAAENVREIKDVGTVDLDRKTAQATSTKHIVIDRSKQTLYAYEGDMLYLETLVSTGLDLTPTPRGVFRVYKKTPSRYMQGPLPGISGQYYDLPGVPWDLYFTPDGGAIHGAYWHNSFGQVWSHGCVNLPLDIAEKLYDWADIGIEVIVQE